MIKKDKQALTFQSENSNDEGIGVYYIKAREELEFSAWYDGFVGISGDVIGFVEFCKALGIEKRTLKRALEAL